MLLLRAMLLLVLLLPGAARAGEVWLGSSEPPWRERMSWQPNDYLDLFTANAPWQHVAAHLTEVRLTKFFIMRAPPAMLRAVVADLTRRHIKIAMQMNGLRVTNDCGRGMEGYGPPEDAARAAERIRDAGGVLDAVVMDEPLWWGHFRRTKPTAPGAIGCMLPVAEVAGQAAAKIAMLRGVFPNVRIGDIEPVGDKVPVDEFNAALAEFFADLQRETGGRLSFFQADIPWLRPGWPAELQTVAAMTARLQIPFGIVYNTTPTLRSDAAWTDSAREHFEQIERRLGVVPAQAVFDSWTEYPVRMLPESDPATHTGLILSYLKFRGVEK